MVWRFPPEEKIAGSSPVLDVIDISGAEFFTNFKSFS
jgi:hypothetical protein